LSSSSPPSPIRVWLITGPPGIGKSTIASRVIYLLRSRGYGVGGCLAKEKKSGRQRVGFTIHDLMSGREGALASAEGSLGPRVGRYRVNVSNLSSIGARALHDAASQAQAIVIDELGPMELTSSEFRKAAEECLKSGRPVFAIMHDKLKDPLIETIREMPDKEVTEVTLQNRDKLPETIAGEMLKLLPPVT
jgi:nucleoside-triphosphatase